MKGSRKYTNLGRSTRWVHLSDYIKHEDGSYCITACGKESPRCERTPNAEYVTCPRCLEIINSRGK